MNTHTNPIALVTGGSRGLGRNTALKLAARGVDVVLTYRSRADEAKAVVAEIERLGARAVALPLDVGDSRGFPAFEQAVREQLRAVWSRERFDYLVNNAGRSIRRSVTASSDRFHDYERVMAVNYFGSVRMVLALLPHWRLARQRNRGSSWTRTACWCRISVRKRPSSIARKRARSSGRRTRRISGRSRASPRS